MVLFKRFSHPDCCHPWLDCLVTVKKLSTCLIGFVIRQHRDGELRERTLTLGAVVRHILTAVITAVGGMIMLKGVGIYIGPVLAAAGIAGPALGSAPKVW